MEGLSLKTFLWLQAGVVVLGIIYLLRGRRPAGLRLRWRSPSLGRLAPKEMSREPQMWDSGATSSEGKFSNAPLTSERSLNVHFNYNGHSWDAYEALGVPAGSSLERVEEAYRAATAEAKPGARDFFSHALKAIREQRRST